MMPTTKLSLLLIFIMAANAAEAAYTNHTVGGPAGWFFNATTSTPSTDYAAWAKDLTFNLGDYLSTSNASLFSLTHFVEHFSSLTIFFSVFWFR